MVPVVHTYSSIDTATDWKKTCFILSDKTDFHISDDLLVTVHTFTRHMLTSLSVDEMLLSRYFNLSTNFRSLPLKLDMALSCLRSHSLQLLAPGNAVGIRLGHEYLREVLDHLHSRFLLQFLQDIVCFLALLVLSHLLV